MDQLTENIATVARRLEQLIQEARERKNGQVGSSNAPARAAALRLMQQKVEVEAHWPIAWPHWPSGVRAKVVAVGQKVIRRLLRWYINPIIKQQNQFNQATLNMIEILADEVSALQFAYLNNHAGQQAQLETLNKQIETLHQMFQPKDP